MGSIGEHFLRMQDNDLDFFVAFFFFLHCCVMTDWLQVLLLTVAKIVVFQTMMTIFQNQGVPKQGNNALRHSVVIAIRALTGHFGSVDTVKVSNNFATGFASLLSLPICAKLVVLQLMSCDVWVGWNICPVLQGTGVYLLCTL